jgi:hypothetical protein
MEREVRDALRAGAIGFTTSRSPAHETPDDRPVASRAATWDEVRRLVGVMGEMNAGIFELAGEGVDRAAGDPGLREYHLRLRDLAVEAGRPITFGVFSRRTAPDVAQVPGPARRDRGPGGRMFAQVHSRWLSIFAPRSRPSCRLDRLPVWKELRRLLSTSSGGSCAIPILRRQLIEASATAAGRRAVGAEAREAEFDRILSSTPWLARTAPWPRWRASAGKNRPRP